MNKKQNYLSIDQNDLEENNDLEGNDLPVIETTTLTKRKSIVNNNTNSSSSSNYSSGHNLPLTNQLSNIYDNNRNQNISSQSNQQYNKLISSRYFTIIMTIYSLLLIAVITFVTIFYLHMKIDEDIMNNKFSILLTKYNTLQQQVETSNIQQHQIDEKIYLSLNTTMQQLNTLNHSSTDSFQLINNQIVELANHSNLEVLDKLQETQIEIHQDLGKGLGNII
jgi:hypothetical protein